MKWISVLKNKEIKNASWLIGGKVVQMVLSLFVSLITARYLGPGNFGLINYGLAYVSFFMSLCTLGINSVIIKDFVDAPEDEGTAIGTAIVLRLLSSICSAIMIIGLVAILDKDEPLTIVVTALCVLSLPFHAFDTINYWFQSRYKSKITSIATLIAYVVMSIYKIILLILGKDVRWFAISNAIDYLCIAACLLIAYKKYKGPKLHFSKEKGKQLLSQSYHYILSGMMVAIYGQTDKLMLKQMLDESAVGYYAAAMSICNMWVFILDAIIDSIKPTILILYEKNYHEYERKNRQLYAIVFYASVFMSLMFLFFGDLVVKILYGETYADAADILRIITWYTAFSYLGIARSAWIVSEGKQKYLKHMYIWAVVINIVLNLVCIPYLGAVGAALASLVTQIFTGIILPFLIKPMRRNAMLMLEGIFLKDTLPNKENKYE